MARPAAARTIVGFEARTRTLPVSYVGDPFAHDLFVSYSHGSDAHGDPMLQRWSVAFVRALREELRADPAFRNTLSIFLDAEGEPGQRLDPALPLTEQLSAQVQSAALLLVMVSPDYQASRWCADERRWWLERQQALGLPATGRIELVHVWPVLAEGWKPDGRWPAELADSAGHPLVGHLFHDNARVGARPLGWTQWRRSEGFDAAVLDAVLDLARVLYGRLDGLREAAQRLRQARADAERLAQAGALQPRGGGGGGDGAGPAAAAADDEFPPTLYLHARVEQLEAWSRTTEALQDGGYSVVPTELLPLQGSPADRELLREKRVNEIAGSDAVLVLGTPGAPMLDADLNQVAKFDRQSAKVVRNKPLPCALLNTAGPALDTPNRRRNASILKAEWLDATGQPVVPVVQRWLQACAGAARG